MTPSTFWSPHCPQAVLLPATGMGRDVFATQATWGERRFSGRVARAFEASSSVEESDFLDLADFTLANILPVDIAIVMPFPSRRKCPISYSFQARTTDLRSPGPDAQYFAIK